MDRPHSRRKTLQIGSSDFKDLLDNNGYFVDKTLFIQEIIDMTYKVLVIPRPRRFGKSLNLSMLRYYFDIAEKDTQALFEPFHIWQAGDFYTSKQGAYPVIFFSLKKGKATTFEQSQQHIYSVLTSIYQQFRWLLATEVLSANEEKVFTDILYERATFAQYTNSLRKLTEYLYRHYGKKTMVLLDEYDAPIHTAFYHGYYKQTIDLMKSFMGDTFKDNPYLQQGVITGILRIAKESIFSDLNNPGIFTILSTAFEDQFGFTEAEVNDMLTYYGMEQDKESVQQWYDGYTFGTTKHLYNPWSVTNYIKMPRDGFKPYWGNTSSDELIKSRIIEKEADEFRETILELIKGETLSKGIEENIVFDDFEDSQTLFWSLLLFAGYLTIVDKVALEQYRVRIPNVEIRFLFQKIVLNWFNKGLKVNRSTLRAMATHLTQNRIKKFNYYFGKLLANTFSHFDTHTEPERVYQAHVLGLLAILWDDYVIKSNREAGEGRYDILLLPRKKNRYGIIMEIKQLKKGASDERIQLALEEALAQIKEKQYHKELEAHWVQQRMEMAMVFVGKAFYVAVKEGKEVVFYGVGR